MAKPTLKPLVAATKAHKARLYADTKARAKANNWSVPAKPTTFGLFAAPIDADHTIVGGGWVMAFVRPEVAEGFTGDVDAPDHTVLGRLLAKVLSAQGCAVPFDVAAPLAKLDAPRLAVRPVVAARPVAAGDNDILPAVVVDDATGDIYPGVSIPFPTLPPKTAKANKGHEDETEGFSVDFVVAASKAVGGATYAAIGVFEGLTCLFVYGPFGAGVVVSRWVPASSPGTIDLPEPKTPTAPLDKAIAAMDPTLHTVGPNLLVVGKYAVAVVEGATHPDVDKQGPSPLPIDRALDAAREALDAAPTLPKLKVNKRGVAVVERPVDAPARWDASSAIPVPSNPGISALDLALLAPLLDAIAPERTGVSLAWFAPDRALFSVDLLAVRGPLGYGFVCPRQA